MTEWWWQCLEREHAVRLELLQQAIPGAERGHDTPFEAAAGGEACAGGSCLLAERGCQRRLADARLPLIKTQGAAAPPRVLQTASQYLEFAGSPNKQSAIGRPMTHVYCSPPSHVVTAR